LLIALADRQKKAGAYNPISSNLRTQLNIQFSWHYFGRIDIGKKARNNNQDLIKTPGGRIEILTLESTGISGCTEIN